MSLTAVEAVSARIVGRVDRPVDHWLSRRPVKLYQIQVTSGAATWTVCRRYSQFRSLHEALSGGAQRVDGMPPLPPKRLLPSDSELDERMRLLETYLQALLGAPLAVGDPRLREFLSQGAEDEAAGGEGEGEGANDATATDAAVQLGHIEHLLDNATLRGAAHQRAVTSLIERSMIEVAQV